MKRLGERGINQWKQIPWDHALDEIAKKLRTIRDRYGPEALATSSGTGRGAGDFARTRFMNLFGSPNRFGAVTICYGPRSMVWLTTFGGSIVPDRKPGKTRMMVLWGRNPHEGGPSSWHSFIKAIRDDMRTMVVDPRCTEAARRAGCWMERPDMGNFSSVGAYPLVRIGEAALPARVPGKYERLNDYELWCRLGIRLGQEGYWPWKSFEQVWEYRLGEIMKRRGVSTLAELIRTKRLADRLIRAVPQLLHPKNPGLSGYEKELIAYTNMIHDFIHSGYGDRITCVYHVIELFDDTPNETAKGKRIA